ncbi:DUF87 domain-containing protein [Nostocaceae cyanobacterium CENA357]|uniref:DUF87 domain-containing protein n=1 Tax=Atlanticothrix silvestris CENA357 TaxID=1725252 RepID=A0A8J7HHD4_9CYAN|nr:DUF87 domain-containing protein [Atlanticothrix silvestris]MBH8552408.1 DUF87 domain-containing protein [Atlanticothrix silvestris CENA357]
MNNTPLFPKENISGIFRGFSEGGLEFHADIVLPYRNDFQSIPMHGQFLLVQLASEDEAVLGRITSFYSDGKLTREHGEDFSLRTMAEDREIPEDLREQYVKYRVNIRVLGVIRHSNGKFVFVASHRRLPHVGSKVAFPSSEILREITGHNAPGADLGFFALGEFIYAGTDSRLGKADWMQVKSPEIVTHFPVENLVSRRSLVFARAGYGKSNLIKLLFSELYKTTPTKKKRDQDVPVGTIIFDPEGEYFWPDDNGRPGFTDVPHLQDKLVIFTRRQAPSAFYGSFVAGGVKLDIRRLPPASIIGIALSPERQEQQNVRKLRGLSFENWRKLVDLAYKDGYSADINKVKRLLNISNESDAEAGAALSNIVYIVRTLHDPNSRLMDFLFKSLTEGKLCIVDISQMRGDQGLILSSLILQEIFNHNQDKFTEKDAKTIPTIAVLEEAQSVLSKGSGSSNGPFVDWFKEGRKYDLGAVMITQQPGSIPVELLSQGDNWFVFHLLSASDLTSLQRANSHFSDDLLGGLLNEPLPGQGVMWSSVSANPYPVSFRALSFERIYQQPLDPKYHKKFIETFVTKLKADLNGKVPNISNLDAQDLEETDEILEPKPSDSVLPEKGDFYVDSINSAIQKLKQHDEFKQKVINGNGLPWGVMMGFIKNFLPDDLQNDNNTINSCIKQTLIETLGEEGNSWKSERRPKKGGNGDMVWVVRITE